MLQRSGGVGYDLTGSGEGVIVDRLAAELDPVVKFMANTCLGPGASTASLDQRLAAVDPGAALQASFARLRHGSSRVEGRRRRTT
jgi:hypothetical protein